MPEGNGVLGAVYDQANQALRISSAAPTGTAGGDLTGTYPNPTLDLTKVHAWTAKQSVVGALASTVVRSVSVTGDANDRQTMTADGTLSWGPGTTAVDAKIARTGASFDFTVNMLVTAATLRIAGNGAGIDINNLGGGIRLFSTSTIVMRVPVDVSAVNIQTDTTTGTKIGTATGQKLGFWNATPVVQQARPTDAASIITLLTTLGLCA